MKRVVGLGVGLLILTSILYQTQAQVQSGLTVCKPWRTSYKKFAPYELSFQLPAKIKPNVGYKSVLFYAVVCKTFLPTGGDDCSEGEYSAKVEAERRRVQALVPTRKAFAANQCPDVAAVGYDMSGKTCPHPFVAVYGGVTRATAEQVRAKLNHVTPLQQ